MNKRIDYVKVAWDYDIRFRPDADMRLELGQTWERIKTRLGDSKGGHTSGQVHLKEGSQFYIEVWGEAANAFLKLCYFEMPDWRRGRFQRIDWRTDREQPIDAMLITMAANQRGKGGASYQNTRPRIKKGDRDRGGQSSRCFSRKSDRSVSVYMITGERPALEGNFRGAVAAAVLKEAVNSYGAELERAGGSVDCAQAAFYDRLMDLLELETAKTALKGWGFQVTDFWEGKELEAVCSAGFNPAEIAARLLELTPGAERQMILDIFGPDENAEARYTLAG